MSAPDIFLTLAEDCYEPKIHSRLTDSLPEAHPLAHVDVYCKFCGTLVHAYNNKCMQTWVQVRLGADERTGDYCVRCFAEFGHAL